ncbi:MAG: NAD(P)/FAD-dependent oxidoreductase [Alphaproteobacteria bacterium]|nr:NAD(P)/FAD-dependent oxidoreductase [Alphaproteobacteria bacterium]
MICCGGTSDNSVEADVAIVGAGVAGLYAAYCCGLSGIRCALIEALPAPGGQCRALYPEKKMYGTPGFVGVKAKDFVSKLAAQCIGENCVSLFGHKVESATKTTDGRFDVVAYDSCHDWGKHVFAKYLAVTTGIGEMKPNIPSTIRGFDRLDEHSDFVQHYCINLDMYRGKRVIIAGGGDTAVDFAVMLSGLANSITLVHRREQFTCERSKLGDIERLAQSGKLKLVLGHNISKLLEEEGRRSVKTVDADGAMHSFETDYTVFCYGYVASASSLFGLKELGVQIENNLIKVDINTMETSLENCYAAGDIVTYQNKKKNVVPCFFEADRMVRSIKNKMMQGEICRNL